MSDDALDAAQVAINTAAQQSGTPVPVANDVPPAPQTPQTVSQTSMPPEPIPEPLPTTPAVHDEPFITKSSKEAMVNELLSSTTIVPSPIVSSSETPPQKSHGSLPKKKSGKGFLLAVLVTFLLTLPVAVYYISQQDEQLADVRSRATCTAYCGEGGSCSTTRPCANGYNCEGGTCHGSPVTDTCGRNADTGAPVCCQDESCSGGTPVCEGQNRLECRTGGVHCTIDADGCTEGTPDNPPDNPPEPTPTPPPTPICLNIKIYKAGVQVTPSTLKPDDLIQITVMGTGAPTKARFRVNGTQIIGDTDTDPNWTISTTKKTGTEEYSVDYTIPTGVTQFLFEAETFAAGAWY